MFTGNLEFMGNDILVRYFNGTWRIKRDGGFFSLMYWNKYRNSWEYSGIVEGTLKKVLQRVQGGPI